MAITETTGPRGAMTETPPSIIRMHNSERQNINFRNAKMEVPVIQNYQSGNNNHKAPPSQIDDKTRKEKKWSIGKLFRRKKKDSGTSSESDDISGKKFENKRKKIPKKNHIIKFDQVAANRPNDRRAQSVSKVHTKEFVDEGILSDPSAGFVGFVGRGLPRLPQEGHLTSRDSLDKRGAGSSCGSQEGSLRKGRKGRMKARVEAIRNSMRNESSSDEESQKSSTSSSIIRFRSDDSLANSRDGSFNKKSRSARTERYIKRLSRDEENVLNKEAELLKKGHSKSEVEMIMRSQSTPNDYVNITPSRKDLHTCYVNIDNKAENLKVPKLSGSISSVQSFSPASIKFNALINDESVTYSIPYQNRNGMHSRQSYSTPMSDNVSYNSLNSSYDNENIMVVKFPIGNGSIKPKEDRAPPVPPRDPLRRLTTPVSAIYENSRYIPLTQNQIMRNHSHSDVFAVKRPISSSDDHIAMQENYYLRRGPSADNQQPRRPASVSADPTKSYFHNNLTYRSHGENKRTTFPPKFNNQSDLIYYADQTPRSRKPIHIRTSHSNLDQRYLSDSQNSLPHSENTNTNYPQTRPRNASEFWRRIDYEENERRKINNLSRTKALSDQTNISGLVSPNKFIVSPSYKSFHNNLIKPMPCRIDTIGTSSAYRQNNIRVAPQDQVDNGDVFLHPERNFKKTSDQHKLDAPKQYLGHIRHRSESHISNVKKLSSDDEKCNDSRKSTNLDEALNELEAIYNSLGLGDEDLLERAEKREQMSLKDIGDLSYCNQNGPPKVVVRPYINSQYQVKRSSIPDKVNDDMAYRRFNFKDKPITQETKRLSSSNVSYMLASPTLNNQLSDDDKPSDTERVEPDVILDDVVYRNIKHAKNHLKVIEPQPPFGIPLGPISPSPQSDYLHANPESRCRSRFICRKSPDIVSDDLAFRTLRKDTKDLLNEDETHNILNHNVSKNSVDENVIPNIKKKRAVRSLSANIFNMIQKEIDDALTMSRIATMERAQSITDLNKSLKEIVSQHKNADSQKLLEKQSSRGVGAKQDTVNQQFSKDIKSNVPNRNINLKSVVKPLRKYTREEFDQAIDVLAKETKDTSDKLGVALAELENIDLSKIKVKNNSVLNKESAITNNDIINISKNNGREPKNLNNSVSDRNNSHHQKLDNLKSNTKTNSKKSEAGKSTEDSLLAISNQLQIVQTKLKNNVENKINFVDEKSKLDEIQNKIKDTIESKLLFTKPTDEVATKKETTHSSNEQLISHEEQNYEKKHLGKSLNSKTQTTNVDKALGDIGITSNAVDHQCEFEEENKKLNELTKAAEDYIKSQETMEEGVFQEKDNKQLTPENIHNHLKNNIGNIVHEISEVNNKLNVVNKAIENNLDDSSIEKDEQKMENDTLEYNSSEELASIFKSEEHSSGIKNTTNNVSEIEDGKAGKSRSEGDLNSPGLVKSIDISLRKVSERDSPEGSSACIPHQRQNSSSHPTNCVPWRKNRGQNNPGTSNGGDEMSPGKACSWYREPGNVMLACSYTLACSQQLAGLDALTILGLILAMISIIAMLII